MAFASAASRRPSIADINITPLVDVMLVLLVIFMVTAPAALQAELVRLREAEPALVLKVSVSPDADYQAAATALAAADRAGIGQLRLD